MTPNHWLRRAAARWPDRPALFRGTQAVATYAEFERAAGSIARYLIERGIKRGDRVAIYMPNSTAYLELLYGVWFAGACAVPINAKLHVREVCWILQDSGAKLIFTDTDQDDLVGEFDVIPLDGPQFEAVREGDPMAPVALEPSDPAWLFYTSGTTGRPKGVVITCANIASMVLCYFADVDNVYEQDATLYAAPMSHGAGLYNFMHVIRGARHLVPESGGFDPAEILELGQTCGPISMFAAPTMVRRLIDMAKARGADGDGLRTIVYAGGPMYEADILDAVDTLGARFVQIYGQGECPMGITALSRDDICERKTPGWQDRLNSVGRAQTAVDVKIVDREGMDVPHGDVGEIVVKGQTVMAGYWHNPDASAGTIRDGWLWTGDMGRMDAQGYVTLQDRSKDVIISGGSNIYPREVEEVLLSHPDVQEAAVIGRRHSEWGEEVVAVIALVPGSEVAETDLNALCLSRIARFKRPKSYVFVEELPKNNYGKILKTDLRARYC